MPPESFYDMSHLAVGAVGGLSRRFAREAILPQLQHD